MLPPVRLRKPRKPYPKLSEPKKPEFSEPSGEILYGSINGMKASAIEERAHRALKKINSINNIEFRRPVNGSRGEPGWKEVDFLAENYGIIYPFEIDTEFTHQGKERADVLHDAIIITALEQEGFTVYPTVSHVDGDKELFDQESADRYFRNFFV